MSGETSGSFVNEDFDASDFDDVQSQALRDYSEMSGDKPKPKKEWPFPIDDIDTSRPPGFVGEVADWIDSQCRYERRNLAVISALISVGNVGGLRHEDVYGGFTANMMAFCVAGSATGKEAVQQATAAIHRAAGVAGAVHGAIKSEQEITRNLLDHQAAFHNQDEIGIFLGKVRNAQKRGGATYLEGVFGLIMSAYSKANSFLLLNGDQKRDIRKLYGPALARAKEEGDEEAAARAEKMLSMVDNGIERPFLSVIGFTTPSTFSASMDGETATQGFVGRSVIVVEKDINPPIREDFDPHPIPAHIEGRLSQLYSGGEFDITARDRVEQRGDMFPVETETEAQEMLRTCSRWFIEYADQMGEFAGEASVAIVRRAYEMLGKVSFILAIESGVRTAEHVRWAMRYIREEIDAKVGLVFANDNEKHDPKNALAAMILAKLDAKKGMSLNVLANGLHRRDENGRKELEAMLASMADKGMVQEVVSGRKYRGKVVNTWKLLDR